MNAIFCLSNTNHLRDQPWNVAPNLCKYLQRKSINHFVTVCDHWCSYPLQLCESSITCGHNVTWWPAVSMCCLKSRSDDIMGRYRVNGLWCFGKFLLCPEVMRGESLVSLCDKALFRLIRSPFSCKRCDEIDLCRSFDDLNGFSDRAS